VLKIEGVGVRPTTSLEDRVDALRALGRFAGCTPEELRSIAESATESTVAPGSVLLREGHRSAAAGHLILSGSAAVEDGDGRDAVGPGTLFGDLADDPRLRNATLTAVTLMHVMDLVLPTEANIARGCAT
jgi:hypothetical protein